MIPRSRPSECIIRPARADEAPTLSALAIRSKAYWGYDELFMAACVRELTVSAAQLEKHPSYVAEVDGRVIGFYVLESVSGDAAELAFLFLEPDSIGQGYGGEIMRHAKKTSISLGYRSMLIQGDPNAEGFYEAMGAVRVGNRPSASIVGRDLPLYRLALGSPE